MCQTKNSPRSIQNYKKKVLSSSFKVKFKNIVILNPLLIGTEMRLGLKKIL